MDESVATLTATIIIFTLIFSLFFCISLYSFMKRIPREHHQFPIWFVWMIMIPWIGFIFECIMLPFGVPNAIKKAYPNDQNLIAKADLLFKIGIAQVVLAFLSFVLRVRPLNDIAAAVSLLLWITYWILIVVYRKYLTVSQ